MPSKPTGSTKNVLIVDDEPDILESLTLSWSYEAPGLRIRTAYSGAAALAAIEVEKPDLILTDYKMPGMDGIEFLRKVREKLPDVPVIMMTAFPDAQLALRAGQEGADLFIAKPFNMENLVTAVQAILAKQAESNARPSAAHK